MTAHTTVSIDDDLAAGQSRIPHRSADNKAAGRVDIDLQLVIDHFLRKDRIDHVFNDGCTDLFLGDIFRMLGGDQDRINTLRFPVSVFDRDLALAVRAQPRQGAVLADFGQLFAEAVREVDRHRHQGGGLIAGISEHDTLVAGTNGFDIVIGHFAALLFQRGIHTHGDIR